MSMVMMMMMMMMMHRVLSQTRGEEQEDRVLPCMRLIEAGVNIVQWSVFTHSIFVTKSERGGL